MRPSPTHMTTLVQTDRPGAEQPGSRSPTGPGPRRRQRRRFVRWGALVVTLALLVPTAASYFAGPTAPGNDSLGIRSTEWLRSHHFRWLVNDVENFWYTHHQPKK